MYGLVYRFSVGKLSASVLFSRLQLPIFWLLLLSCTLPACTTVSPNNYLANPKLNSIMDGKMFLGKPVSADQLPSVDMLAVSPEMRDFVSRHVTPVRGRSNKVKSLLSAIINPGLLGLKYGENHTRTAAQAFQSLGANCLSFSSLYIALAREAGLKAEYQEVLLPPEEDMQGATLILRRHVNVIVDGASGRQHVVDFNPFQQDANSVDAVLLSDKEAFAQYYNNIAMEKMDKADYKGSYLYLRKALDIAPREAFLWSNMGVLLSRDGRMNLAEAAMLHAVALKPSERAPLVNLAALYEGRGDLAKSALYTQQIEKYRKRNPYYLLIEARQAFSVADFERSQTVIDKAISLKKSESLFYELKAKVMNELGMQQDAEAQLMLAIEFADTVSQRTRYRARLVEWQRLLASGSKDKSGAS